MKRSLALGAALSLLVATNAMGAHAIAQFGQPKYPAGFAHFGYVNPNAPKTGEINLSTVTQYSSFDTYNPFAVKGKAAPGVQDLIFETLTVNSLDEVNTQYGLLAEDIAIAPDERSVTFRLHRRARFSNGEPVTAADVVHSFATLTGKGASPRFRAYFSELNRPVAVDARTVRFAFKRPGRDLSFVAGSLPVFSRNWGLKADGSRVPFGELRLTPPIGSGPYLIERASSGLSITFRRNPNYWGRDVPVRRGSFNFQRITYKLYKDADTQVAAMRSGDFDFFAETRMRYWCCQFIGKRFDSGELIKEKVFNASLSPMNGYVFNLRRERFKDKRVRQALALAYDWEWLNEKIFDNEFERQQSYFDNSALAAAGRPQGLELALLTPHRTRLDPAVFGPVTAPPVSTGPGGLRGNFTKAVALLAEAGWTNRDGVLRNAKGEPFVIEVPGAGGVLLDAYYNNLRKLGFVLKRRVADPAADRARLREYDFDFTSFALRKARDPAPELYRNFHGPEGRKPGADNLAGVDSPVVDALILKVQQARTQAELEAATRALDRVMLSEYYVLPWRYLKNHYIIRNRKLRRPAVTPLYFGPYEWVLAAWWAETPAR
ncbi:extracellular solute-binding protein [Phenylobacterium sp. LjRoot219]|uniref:extracellular solute-binding protein n=1 Tax=Phenylobacterium sp. LjRoot219 TaxID=3342283 RepID=UPI003ECF45EE